MSVSYVAEMDIDLGEKVHIRSVIKPKCEAGLPFAIKSARYELLDARGIVEASGDCTITDHVIDALVSPKAAGTYQLKYIYEIADEIWVDNVKLRVG